MYIIWKLTKTLEIDDNNTAHISAQSRSKYSSRKVALEASLYNILHAAYIDASTTIIHVYVPVHVSYRYIYIYM